MFIGRECSLQSNQSMQMVSWPVNNVFSCAETIRMVELKTGKCMFSPDTIGEFFSVNRVHSVVAATSTKIDSKVPYLLAPASRCVLQNNICLDLIGTVADCVE